MFDLLIRNARVIDGTGASARAADVAVGAGCIAEIGKIAGPAKRTIDAHGLALAPGFVDVHTHYDAQVFWDPTLSPSAYHGVTTVLAGNCGFSIAPLAAETAPYLLRMLARVEGMPEESLRQGVPWDWTSFGDYLARIENRVGLNIGVMCGHSAIRLAVMGPRATSQPAGSEDLARMEAMLADSLAAGAFGFSSSTSSTHNDAEGHPVPSRHASPDELIALARVCRDYPGTMIGLLPGVDRWSERELSLMTEMSAAAQRALNWNALIVAPGNAEFLAHQLSVSDRARQAGGEVLGLAIASSPTIRLNFLSGFLLDCLPGWEALFELPIPARLAALRDPERRRELAKGAEAAPPTVGSLAHWGGYMVSISRDKALEGKRIGELAQRWGKTPFDAFLDVAIADELETIFLGPQMVEDEEIWRRRAELWRDRRTVIGASDAGAHLDMLDAFSYSTALLAAARDHRLASVEEAVHWLTEVPASLLNLKDRGLIKEGWRADLVLFDPDAVGPAPTYARHDLPGGQLRLYAEAKGVKSVLVNGRIIVEDGAHTGALPGRVLRSGQDTGRRVS
jgi:N-acyl-D-aspartate/D-glutamate deacylase